MPEQRTAGSPGEVFKAFLMLGLTSFGGPIAHLGYFRSEFVERRRWLTERDYADLVALCQFLPGPASSQVGFALGLMRAGCRGAAAAWLAFTLPSAVLMTLFALGAARLDAPLGEGLLEGLKLAAVAVVAHAVLGMARTLCPDRRRSAIALAAVAMVTLVGGPLGQLAAILAGALGGMLLCRTSSASAPPIAIMPLSRRAGHAALAFALALFVGLPLLVWLEPAPWTRMLDAFYRAGALVFGGGHVVLPLLESEVVQPGWVPQEAFLAGYGAAQAVPGPLFTFAAYLGAVIAPLDNPLLGAGVALGMIFLPGLLLLLAALPHWNRLRRLSGMQGSIRGANAAVVGILGAVLYQPLWTGTVQGSAEFLLVLTGFVLLGVWKAPAWLVVLILAAGGALLPA
ncbi:MULTISPECIES: chromate efflux transporter [unclassified Modicisalibacter]|uniref:chromate efflux transporter n=1 Tax=unclassified Modicisalibacter TaxID=2679913 RepID=UPI001CC9923D|nr:MULTISPECIES: chromate efflux transporter [unclassified Modicisalibacter]MBZ9558562.1 chromate efflux transporter [Modicisalibacter sp. R2A 31.J]MBZ9575546.1 chromate efflux transporter [Modicisalibacter sp. MOD 31.J]